MSWYRCQSGVDYLMLKSVWSQCDKERKGMACFSLEDFHVAHLAAHFPWYLFDHAVTSFVWDLFILFCRAVETVTRIRCLLGWSWGKWWSLMKQHVVLLGTRLAYPSLPSCLVVTKLEREARGELSGPRITIWNENRIAGCFPTRIVFIHERFSAWSKIIPFLRGHGD